MPEQKEQKFKNGFRHSSELKQDAKTSPSGKRPKQISSGTSKAKDAPTKIKKACDK